MTGQAMVTDADVDLGAISTPDTTTQTDDTAPLTETTTDSKNPETQTETTDKAESTDAKSEKSEPAKVEITEKLRNDATRMARALANLQAKNKELESKLASAGDKSGKSDQPAKTADTQAEGDDDHPALKGLTPDDDGEYKVNGRFYTREELIERYEDKQTVAELRDRLDARERQEAEAAQAREDAARQKELDDSREDVLKEVSKTIESLRKDLLPGVPDDKAAKVDRNIVRMVDEIVTAKLSKPNAEFTAELLADSITEAFDEARDLFGVWGSAQIADNEEHKAEHPVTAPGTPGAKPPTDPLLQPKSIAHKLADRAAQLVDQTRGRRS